MQRPGEAAAVGNGKRWSVPQMLFKKVLLGEELLALPEPVLERAKFGMKPITRE